MDAANTLLNEIQSWLAIIKEIPQWLGTAIFAAAIGFLGFLGKQARSLWNVRRIDRSNKIASLQELSMLLKASRGIFEIQLERANKLRESIKKNHSEKIKGCITRDQMYTKAFDDFTPDEQDLHAVVRSYTETAQKVVNNSLSNWLKKDVNFKSGVVPLKNAFELAEKLHELELHLNLWHAKYETWIPEHPKHALVFLDDAAKHGVAFPKGIEKLVNQTIKRLKPIKITALFGR